MRRMSLLLLSISTALFPALASSQVNLPFPTPTPSPSASPSAGQSDYLLLLNPGVSSVMVGSMKFNTQTQNQTSDGCTLGISENDPVLCVTSDTCGGTTPSCGIFFVGPSGLSLADVAKLSTLSSPSLPLTPVPSGSPLVRPGTLAEHLDAAITALRGR